MYCKYVLNAWHVPLTLVNVDLWVTMMNNLPFHGCRIEGSWGRVWAPCLPAGNSITCPKPSPTISFAIGAVADAEGHRRCMIQNRPFRTPSQPGIIKMIYIDPTQIHLDIKPTILIMFNIYHFHGHQTLLDEAGDLSKDMISEDLNWVLVIFLCRCVAKVWYPVSLNW